MFYDPFHNVKKGCSPFLTLLYRKKSFYLGCLVFGVKKLMLAFGRTDELRE